MLAHLPARLLQRALALAHGGQGLALHLLDGRVGLHVLLSDVLVVRLGGDEARAGLRVPGLLVPWRAVLAVHGRW
eukprot:10925855-Alexandrium_andersonii.AAC.1